MDLLTASTTFATLVSLFSDFLDKREVVSSDDYQIFLDWLSENRHDELKKLLEQNQATVTSIKAILNQESSAVLEKLKNIDAKLGNILSTDSLFRPLVQAVSPLNSLSEQAISILIQFEKSGSSRVLESNGISSLGYLFVDKAAPNLVISDPRFIRDDFASLVELGLLKFEIDRHGGKLYLYTRAASELLKSSNRI